MAGVGDGGDERLHVAVAVAGAFAVHPEPTVFVLGAVGVFLAYLLGVLDRALTPDLARVTVDPAPAAELVALQEDGQFFEVNRQRAERRRRPGAASHVELVGEFLVAIPASLAPVGTLGGEICGAGDVLSDGGQKAVAE